MNVFWNETAFPVCSATDSCWNRKVDSLTSPVMLVIRLPISRTSFTAWWCQVPPVLMATGKNTWVLLLILKNICITHSVGGQTESEVPSSSTTMTTSGKWWFYKDKEWRLQELFSAVFCVRWLYTVQLHTSSACYRYSIQVGTVLHGVILCVCGSLLNIIF